MIIRDYRPPDLPGLFTLWKETGIYTVERGDTKEVINRSIVQGGTLLILEDPDSGTIAGSSWLTYDGRRVFLHHFAIWPSLQGKGLGRDLAMASLEFARSKGCPVKLEVHRDNEPAIALYRSLGFEPFESYGIYMNLDP